MQPIEIPADWNGSALLTIDEFCSLARLRRRRCMPGNHEGLARDSGGSTAMGGSIRRSTRCGDGSLRRPSSWTFEKPGGRL